MENLLPYLNVLEADTITRDNVTKALVIDKDDNIALLNGEDLGTNNYQDLQNKPEINGVSLNGNLTASELGLASTSNIPTKTSQLTNDSGYITSLDGYATEEWVNSQGFATNESVTEGLAGKQDELVEGNGINISGNTISADYSSIDNKPSLNGKTLEASTNIVPAIQVQAIPTKLTITPSLGNQTGQAVELPGYDTSTNASGILTSQVFGILNDKYTKEEIDNINSAINTAISKKQDKLTAGANIRIVDNVISAFNNHLFLHLDENDTEHQAYVYSFIKSNLEFYLFAEITYEGKVVVLPLVAIENNESLDLKGMYLKDDSTIVEVSAVLVANGNISVDTSEISISGGSGGTGDYNQLTNKPQINSVELSGNKTLAALGIQAAGNYATTSDLALKADKSTVDALQEQVTSNTSAIATKQDTLVSGESIRTINNLSLLGEGNINVGDVPSITVENEQIPNETDFNRVAEAAANNRAVLIRIKTTEMTLTSNYWQYASSESQRIFIAYATYLSETNNITLMAYIIENQPVMVETYSNILQEELVSGTNIKTINGQTILGSGNIEVGGGGTSDYTQLTNKPQINSVELTGNKSLSDIGAQPAGDYALKSEIPDVSGLATKEEVTTVLNSRQNTLVSGTNIKTINSQSLVGSGNIDTQDIPTLYVSRYKNVSDTVGFDKVKNAILTNKPFLIYFNLEEGNIDMLCDSALTFSGIPTITTVFHREFTQNPTDHKVYTVTITKNELPNVTEFVHNYINYGTGTQPQIYTITVLTQEEYNALSTKDSNTQYLIVE